MNIWWDRSARYVYDRASIGYFQDMKVPKRWTTLTRADWLASMNYQRRTKQNASTKQGRAQLSVCLCALAVTLSARGFLFLVSSLFLPASSPSAMVRFFSVAKNQYLCWSLNLYPPQLVIWLSLPGFFLLRKQIWHKYCDPRFMLCCSLFRLNLC